MSGSFQLLMMQHIINFFGQGAADAFGLRQVVYAGGNDTAQAAKAGEQCLATLGADAGETKAMLEIIIEQANVPVIVDAGIGAPSHAAAALEMGADAVLVNTAIAVAGDPIAMARAFKMAVEAGRIAYESGLGAVNQQAIASSPLAAFLETLA